MRSWELTCSGLAATSRFAVLPPRAPMQMGIAIRLARSTPRVACITAMVVGLVVALLMRRLLWGAHRGRR